MVHFIVQYTTISRFINDEIILLLIASFVNDRLWCFLYKLHTVIVILVTSVTQKKYYRSYNFFLFGKFISFINFEVLKEALRLMLFKQMSESFHIFFGRPESCMLSNSINLRCDLCFTICTTFTSLYFANILDGVSKTY